MAIVVSRGAVGYGTGTVRVLVEGGGWRATEGELLGGACARNGGRTLQGRRAASKWDGLRHHFSCSLIKMSLGAAANHSANRMRAAKKGCQAKLGQASPDDCRSPN